jgi:signal transduction histidine kinase
MTLPDVRRLLQLVLAIAAPRHLLAQGIALSEWRQERNRIAHECHAKTRRRRRRQQLRDTG